MDRGTRRFTTSSPASAGTHAQTPGVHRGSFVRSSFWHPCRSLVGTRRPCRRLRSRHSSQDRRRSSSVKTRSKWPIRCAFLRQDARATERQVDPDPDLAVEDALRERPRSGPTDSHVVVESARADILRCRPRVSPSTRAPAYPFAGRPVTVGTGLRRARALRHEGDGVSDGLLWARDCLPSSATHVRRAGTSASRESSSARGCLPLSALPGRRLPVASGSPSLRPGDLQHLVETKERATSFSRLGCLHPLRVLLVWCDGERSRRRRLPPRTSTTGVDSGREMTPRNHAFCRPSPRTPCGGVASFEARTVRLMAPASVEGGSSGNCFSERAWAEHRRVKGTGPVTRLTRFPGCSVLPSSIRCSSTLCRRRPGKPRSGDRYHHACVGQGCLRFRLPAKGSGCRATRVLGSLRKYVNGRWIAPTARPTDLRSRHSRERALQSDRPAPFLSTGTRPNLTGEARLLWLGRCPRESFSWNPGPRLSFWLARGSGPTAAPENDHCDSCQLAA